jgi:hypothetical protein
MATNWTRKQQEQEGKYFFSGNFYCTQRVNTEIPQDEIMAIYNDVKEFVKEKNGVDYLQVFEDRKGGKLFFIDQLNEEMIASGGFTPEDNHCTLMFASEY